MSGESGGVYRRNRVHIRPTTVTVQDSEPLVSVNSMPVAVEELISSPPVTGEVLEPPTPIVPDVPAESTLVSDLPLRTRQKQTYLKDYV